MYFEVCISTSTDVAAVSCCLEKCTVLHVDIINCCGVYCCSCAAWTTNRTLSLDEKKMTDSQDTLKSKKAAFAMSPPKVSSVPEHLGGV